MIYSTPEFLILFALTLTFYLASSSQALRFNILLVASLLFYSWAGLFDALIFAFVVIVSWLATWFATRFPEQKRTFLVGGIVVMTLHLFFWKYAPWASGEVQKVAPGFLGGRKLSLPLPVGISFFTLQGIAYLVDYMRGEAEFIHLKEYLLFKSFFAQLVAGPIVRVPQLLPQLRNLKRPTTDDLATGLGLFCLGFFKKLFIADRTATFVDGMFQRPFDAERIGLVMGLLGYTVQIWADFSGYTDMGRGAARMLGIRLPENFMSPYLSRTPSEFWRRWHITLSEWIRDYIYKPLGGSRGSRPRVLSVAITTMAISGLWHGANWTFVIWGLYHGLLLVAERLLRGSPVQRLFSRVAPGAIGEILLGATTFVAVVFGWLIFRANDFGQVVTYLKAMAHPAAGSGLVGGKAMINAFVGLVICAGLHVLFYPDLSTQRRPALAWFADDRRPWVAFVRGRAGLLPWVGVASGGLLAATVVLALAMRRADEVRAFIYFQF